MRAAAATDEQIEKLLKKFGYMLASPKLDGIRCSVQHQAVLTKSLKSVPNEHIVARLSDAKLHGLDGELIVGKPNVFDTYNSTYRGVMKIKEKPDFKLYVFDNCITQLPYHTRRPIVKFDHPDIVVVTSVALETMADVLLYEETILDMGFEGVILRDPHALYKHGKSTALEGGSIKIKRFTDGEAVINSMEEQLHNTNAATTNELGRTQRSSHKENKIPMNTLGTLVCTDIVSGVEVRLGIGLSKELRQKIWDNFPMYKGKMVKYKSFKIGVKDKPRHPVFLGFRHPSDM